MSITAYQGKPSGGKTLCAVSEIARYLYEDGRFIVTNVSLVLDELQRWMLKNGHPLVDVYARVRLLNYSESSFFWRYRGGPRAIEWGSAPTVARAHEWAENVRLRLCSPELVKEQAAVGVVLPEPPLNQKEYSAEWLNVILEAAAPLGGCIFVIDEMHEHLNARNWMRHGLVAADYAGIHAHMGDDVIWISQAPSLVDTQFRVRTQEYVYCENLSKSRVGWFNRGGMRPFRKTAYLEPYTGAKGQIKNWSKDVSLDTSLAKCYKRSRFGGDGDTKEKPKGLHWWWLWVLFGVIMLVLMVLCFVGPRVVINYFMRASSPSPAASVSSGSSVSTDPPVQHGPVVAPVVAPRYRIIRETFRGLCESPAMLFTAEGGCYQVGKMSPQGFVKGLDVRAHCALVSPPDGSLLYVVALECALPAGSPVPLPERHDLSTGAPGCVMSGTGGGYGIHPAKLSSEDFKDFGDSASSPKKNTK